MTRVGSAVRGGGGIGLGFRFWPELLTEEPDFEMLAVFGDFAEDNDWSEVAALRWLVKNEKWPAYENRVGSRLNDCPWEWWATNHMLLDSPHHRASLPFVLGMWKAFMTLDEALRWFFDNFKVWDSNSK